MRWILISMFVCTILLVPNVSAATAWWDANWAYRNFVTISAGGNTSGIPVFMRLDWNISMNDDFSDLRFIDSNLQELDYWFEYNVSQDYVEFWVELVESPNFYIYFGNPSALYTGNFSATVIGDEFNSNTTDNYTNVGAINMTYNTSCESLPNNENPQCMTFDNQVAGERYMYSNYANPYDNITFVTRYRTPSYATDTRIGIQEIRGGLQVGGLFNSITQANESYLFAFGGEGYVEGNKIDGYNREWSRFNFTVLNSTDVNETVIYQTALNDSYLSYNNLTYNTRNMTINNRAIFYQYNSYSYMQVDFWIMDEFIQGLTYSVGNTERVENVIDDCSTNSIYTVNFTLENEEGFTDLTGDIEITFDVGLVGNVISYNFTSINKNIHPFCVDNETTSALTNMTLKYIVSGYADRWYHLIDVNLTNSTTLYTLYSLNESEASYVEFEIKNAFHSLQEDVVVYVQKYFPSNGTYFTVAMGKTGFNGKTTIPLKFYERYRLLLYQHGTLLRLTTSKELSETSETVFTTVEEQVPFLRWYNDVSFGCSYDNTTKVLTCMTNDTSNNVDAFRLRVTQLRAFNYSDVVCEDIETGATVTLSCDLTGHTEGFAVHYVIAAQDGDDWFVIFSGYIEDIQRVGNWGSIGLLLALMTIVTLAFVGLWNPTVSLLLAFMGILIAHVLGMVDVSLGAVIGMGVVFAIIIYKVSR